MPFFSVAKSLDGSDGQQCGHSIESILLVIDEVDSLSVVFLSQLSLDDFDKESPKCSLDREVAIWSNDHDIPLCLPA